VDGSAWIIEQVRGGAKQNNRDCGWTEAAGVTPTRIFGGRKWPKADTLRFVRIFDLPVPHIDRKIRHPETAAGEVARGTTARSVCLVFLKGTGRSSSEVSVDDGRRRYGAGEGKIPGNIPGTNYISGACQAAASAFSV